MKRLLWLIGLYHDRQIDCFGPLRLVPGIVSSLVAEEAPETQVGTVIVMPLVGSSVVSTLALGRLEWLFQSVLENETSAYEHYRSMAGFADAPSETFLAAYHCSMFWGTKSPHMNSLEVWMALQMSPVRPSSKHPTVSRPTGLLIVTGLQGLFVIIRFHNSSPVSDDDQTALRKRCEL